MVALLWTQYEGARRFIVVANHASDLFYPLMTGEVDHHKAKLLGLSFNTAKDLRRLAELLPSGPHWHSMEITPSHPTKHKLYLYWRDTLECIMWIFNHPSFHDQLDLIPEWQYTSRDKLCRVYTEWMTGDSAWQMQVSDFHINIANFCLTLIRCSCSFQKAPCYSERYFLRTKQTLPMTLAAGSPTPF
jgi:hypothetical protein